MSKRKQYQSSVFENIDPLKGTKWKDYIVFSPKETAQILSVSHKMVLRHLENGNIKGAIKTGSHWKIPRDLLLVLLREGFGS